jgi:hypothetical protein
MALKPLTYQRTPIAGDTAEILKPKTARAYTKPAARILNVGMFVSVARKQRRSTRDSTVSAKQWPAVKQWRRVVGKVSKSNAAVSWKGHGYYLQREKANEERACFDREIDDGVNAADRLKDWQQSGDTHITKIVLSPEYTDGLDVKKYTRNFIRSLEADHKTTFEWVAAVHTNTDHTHIHVVIRGIATNGRKIDFSRDYIRDRVSAYACGIATEMAGMDTRQHERSHNREQEREKSRVNA